MRTVVVGGTGFLGSAVAERLAAAGHEVVAAGRTPPAGPLPTGVRFVRLDVNAAADTELTGAFDGADGVVHALGPDDRSPLHHPVEAYLARELVGRTVKVAHAARVGGVRRLVVLGSYFAALERLRPGFAAPHPYVRARLAQHAAAVAAGGDDLTVCTVEIPFVFGCQPGRVSQWAGLYALLRRLPVIPCPDGGTTAVTRDTVADAVAAALERGRPGAGYPVGDGDLDWRRWIAVAADELGLRRRIVRVPRPLTAAASRALMAWIRLTRQASGLAPDRLADLLHSRLHVDHAATRAELGLPRRALEPAIRASVRAGHPVTPAAPPGALTPPARGRPRPPRPPSHRAAP